MRIDSPCRATLQEILDHGSVKSRSSVEHLLSCQNCREQLASFALGWSQIASRAVDQDEGFADQVVSKIEHRARRRRMLRLTGYSLASLAAAAVGVYYAGADIMQNGLIPAGQFVAGAVAKIPSMGQSIYAAFAKVLSGPVTIAVAAGLAVVWVSMLDRVATYIRLHRA